MTAPARGRLASIVRSAGDAAYDATVLARLGLLAPARPDRLLRAAWQILQWDATLAAGCTIAATLHPNDPALVDDRGTLIFSEVHRRTNALARGLQQAGIEPGARVAMLCRNHAGFAEAILAASKLGADVLLLNTGLAPPQLRELLRRERPRVLIHDDEFLEGVKIRGLRRLVAWHDDRPSATTLEELITGSDPRGLPPPTRHGHLVILTSGTTGAPKAAARRESDSLGTPLALLGRIPLRARGVTHIASPLFHSWGYLHFGLASAVSATVVLRRRFDPEALLATVARDRVDTLVVVPTMLARILELPYDTRRRYDTSSLRVVVVSGSALQGDLATRFMQEFGEILYNLYGSTEVSWAAIATPADLRAAPGTVGRPPRGTRVAIFDELGRRLPAGSRGRIFVGNKTAFDGYTDGGGKQLIDGLVSTGDVGHIDDAGRLFVDGREDEMIVSGGENIFPSEVEDALALHPGVAEVAVVGVEDERFGQRLHAYVVASEGPAVSEEELKQLVRTRLAPFKVPREIEFVSELPHTESGKLTKVGLGRPRP
jgi:fatty-acyl-CoA synthase